jgi:hypothetical protein
MALLFHTNRVSPCLKTATKAFLSSTPTSSLLLLRYASTKTRGSSNIITSTTTERLYEWQTRLQKHQEKVNRVRAERLSAENKPQTFTNDNENMESWTRHLNEFDPLSRKNANTKEIFQKLGLDWVDEGMGVDARIGLMADEASKPLFLERGRARKLWFNRPQALNAVTLQMLQSLERVLPKWEHWDLVRGVLWLSRTEASFCAGVDLVGESTRFLSSFFLYF